MYLLRWGSSRGSLTKKVLIAAVIRLSEKSLAVILLFRRLCALSTVLQRLSSQSYEPRARVVHRRAIENVSFGDEGIARIAKRAEKRGRPNERRLVVVPRQYVSTRGARKIVRIFTSRRGNLDSGHATISAGRVKMTKKKKSRSRCSWKLENVELI